jgi:hypothetical protein
MITIPTDTYLMWIAAFFYILATSVLIHRIRKNNLGLLYPISVYLGGIASFFILMGFFQISKNLLIPFFAGLAVMFGASTITRFVLKLEIPNFERFVYYFLLALSLSIAGFTFSTGKPPIMLRSAHAFAFVTAGLFTMGYIIYSGLKSQSNASKIKSVSTGVSLGLCCVVAHGLAFSQLIVIAIPLFGFTLNAPMLFALMSPLAFIMVLYMTRHMNQSDIKITYAAEKPKVIASGGSQPSVKTYDFSSNKKKTNSKKSVKMKPIIKKNTKNNGNRKGRKSR